MSSEKPRRLYVVCGAHGHESPSVICTSRDEAEEWVERQYSSHQFVVDVFELRPDGAYRYE